MSRVELAEPAEADLRQISACTRDRWGEAQRERYTKSLRDRLEWLAIHADTGQRQDAISPGLLSVRVERHVIFYRVVDDRVFVLRILHERMDFARHLGDDDEDDPPFTP